MAGRGRVTRFEMGGSSCASTSRIRAIWLVMAAVTLVVVPPGHAAGTLDPTFANGATTLPDLRSLSIAVSPDQRIAIAGTGWSGSYAQIKYGAVGVFDSAGSRQATFGGSLPLPPGTNNHSADAVAFDLQGRTLVSGARLSSAGAFTVRLRADGTPSATYANGAPGVMPPSRVGSALALAVDSKGRIVIGGSTASIGGGTTGSSSYTQAAIARLTDDGASDLSFGAGGQVALASGGVVRTLALDRNGGIVFAFGGSAFGSADGETKIMMRLRDDGSFDTAFGNGGQAVIPDAVTVAGDADGRMLAIVRRLGGVEGSYLLRFVDGLPDPTFGVGGAAPLPRAYRTLTAAADGSAFWPKRSSAPSTPKSGEHDDHTAPRLALASMAMMASGIFGNIPATRSPTPTPAWRKACAACATCWYSSAQLNRRSTCPSPQNTSASPSSRRRSRFSATFKRPSGNQRASRIVAPGARATSPGSPITPASSHSKRQNAPGSARLHAYNAA